MLSFLTRDLKLAGTKGCNLLTLVLEAVSSGSVPFLILFLLLMKIIIRREM